MESVGIPQEKLLAFIDGLNLAMTASPPLRVVNLAGMVIGFVPYHWAMFAGTAIQVGAQVGTRVLSKRLTDRYLRAANLRLFKPRGLSVRICTAAAMQHLVMKMPIAAPPSKLTRFGRGVGSLLMQLPIPITSTLVHAVADAPPRVPAMGPDAHRSKKLLASQRRVAALAGHALPLDFDVPKPAKAQGVMDTMASWGVKFDSSSTAQRRRRRPAGTVGFLTAVVCSMGAVCWGGDSSSWAVEVGEAGISKEMASLAVMTGGGLERIVSAGVSGEKDGLGTMAGGRNADLLEYWQSAKVLWVVIMSSEMDEAIEGIERAESREDEERVDERTWQAEMGVEMKDLEFDREVERVAATEDSMLNNHEPTPETTPSL
ncbi:hypothetical protein DFH07DRAFT_752319 [Mycena maculata]|uniref:Uncharacterized protein n=1 Tax=Mycena maculata TaxID=230809 RepID=A0AAD7MZM0_9AGAR|nr:hypothetical protein DFH07DRAFT_752319 [Mycena maculata]